MRFVSSQGTYDAWSIAYYSTPTRAGEILAGVVLAYVVTSPRFVRLRRDRRFPIAAQTLGVLGGLGLLWIWHAGGIRWDNLHLWTLPCSVATVCLILACLSRGPVTWALELRPIRWMGRVSYGAYLYQILVFFCVTEGTTGIHNPRILLVVRLAAVFAVAGLSHRFIESPLRHRREPQGWRLVFIYGGVGVVLAVIALALPFPKAAVLKTPTGPFSESNSAARFDATRLQVTGDVRVDDGLAPLADVARQSGGDLFVQTHTGPFCPMVPTTGVVIDGRLRRPEPTCLNVRSGLLAAGADRPDVVVFSQGLGDLVDHVSPEGEVTHIGQDGYDESVVSRLRRFMDSYRWSAPAPSSRGSCCPRTRPSSTRDDLTTTAPSADATEAAVEAAKESGRLSDDEVRQRIRHWNGLVRKVARSRENVVLVDEFDATADGWRTLLDDPRLSG